MTRVLLNVVLLLIICLPSLIAIRCKPPDPKKKLRDTEFGDSADSGSFDESVEIIPDEFYRSVPAESERQARNADIKTRRRRQKTFIRNPNYISANKEFDKLAENMYMLTLPKPHPGALAGSANGCEHYDEEKTIKFLEVGL